MDKKHQKTLVAWIIVIMLVSICFGFYAYNENKKQDYFLYRSSLCYELGQKEKMAFDTGAKFNEQGLRIKEARYAYSVERDDCFLETTVSQSFKVEGGTFYTAAIKSLFGDRAVTSAIWSSDEPEPDCTNYHKIRAEYFGPNELREILCETVTP